MINIIEEKNRSLKQSNRFAVLNALRGVKEISIAVLAKETELSKPTIKKVLDHYIYLGLVKEAGKGRSTEEGGKKPLLYKFDENYSYVISSQLGPNFINSALLNFRGEIVESKYVDLDPGVTYESVLNFLVTHIYKFKELKGAAKINSIVLALPGIVDPEAGILKYSPHFGSWDCDLDFRCAIEKRMGKEIPIYTDNINRYEAFMEMLEGKAVGIDDFVTIDVLEEGVGSGLIIGGKLSHGSQNIAGEIGHTIVNTYNGCTCICGGTGCFEAEVSWRNIRRLIMSEREQFLESELFSMDNILPKDLFRARKNSDPLAVKIMDQITTYFARGINNLILSCDPKLVIIQGIYNGAGEEFINEVKKKVDSTSLLSLKRDTKICFSEFGLDRGVRGAGLYLIEKFFCEDIIYQ